MARTNTRGSTIEGEAWLHLLEVEDQLAALKKLATPDTYRLFVRALNDFISSARKTVNYLLREPNRPKGFKAWARTRLESFRAQPRIKFFYDLRNISDKECPVAPHHAEYGTSIVESLVLRDDVETELKDAETGEVIARISAASEGLRDEDRTITVHKGHVKYFFKGWPTEDALTFLDFVVGELRDLVVAAYDTFPNNFQLHRVSRPILTRKTSLRP